VRQSAEHPLRPGPATPNARGKDKSTGRASPSPRRRSEPGSATLDEAVAWLGAREIAWLDAVEPGGREWASVAEHRAFNEAVASVLSSGAGALASGLASSEIGEGVVAGAADKPSAKPWLAALNARRAAVKAAIEGTESGSAAYEKIGNSKRCGTP
jgi:hypothetical protein